jgi:hypothetical protein
MKWCVPCAVVLGCALLPARAQDKGANQYRDAKVGDYAVYKAVVKVMGTSAEVVSKQVVAEKTEKEATVKVTSTRMGMPIPVPDLKVDLTKPFAPQDFAATAQRTGMGTFEKTGDGKEKVKIGEKTYDCDMVKGKLSFEVMGRKIETEVKVWTSRSAPLSGLVRMESKSAQTEMVLELTESGTEKK